MGRFFWVRSCLLITLIKCLKGHKSLGSLGSVVKGFIVSLVGPRYQGTKGQGHLLSCLWTANNKYILQKHIKLHHLDIYDRIMYDKKEMASVYRLLMTGHKGEKHSITYGST